MERHDITTDRPSGRVARALGVVNLPRVVRHGRQQVNLIIDLTKRERLELLPSENSTVGAGTPQPTCSCIPSADRGITTGASDTIVRSINSPASSYRQ